MGIGIEEDGDDSRMKGPPSILKKSGGSVTKGGESMRTAGTARSRTRPKSTRIKTPAGTAPKENKETMSWGKNNTKTFVNDEEESEDSVESVTSAADHKAGGKAIRAMGRARKVPIQ